jgi:hypothetical protein
MAESGASAGLRSNNQLACLRGDQAPAMNPLTGISLTKGDWAREVAKACHRIAETKKTGMITGLSPN